MTTTTDVGVSAGVDRLADAFGPVTLANFAQNPSGAHVFRAQHELLSQLMAAVLRHAEAAISGEAAYQARVALTSLTSLLPVHQGLEDALVHRSLAADPRARMMAEQFEREMAPLVAELASLSRRFPTASSILHSPKGEFVSAVQGFFTRLQERFRREERDLFPAFDRTANGVLSTAAA